MAGLTSLAVSLSLAILLLVLGGNAQDCYYPNGGVSPNDAPCSADGGACCPFNWQCLSNGLCFLEAEGYYERHSCTDQTWEDEKCPQICTYNGTAAGNEAILLCDEHDEASWCCDANRVFFNCCQRDGVTTFSATFATPVAQISSQPSSKRSTASPTTIRDTTTSSTSRSNSATSPASTTSLSADPEPSPPTTSTATLTSLTSDSNGQISTMISISVITTAASTPPPDPESTLPATTTYKRRLSIILGLSICIPLALLAAAALLFILRHQRKRVARTTSSTRSNTDIFNPADVLINNPYGIKPELEANEQEQQQEGINLSELPATAAAPNELPAPSPSSDVRRSIANTSSFSPLSLGVPFERDARWSAVSALSGEGDGNGNNSNVSPQSLQAVSQQHYGPSKFAGTSDRPLSGISPGTTYQPYRPSLAPIRQQEPVELEGSLVSGGNRSTSAR